jgi:hypothetical protein
MATCGTTSRSITPMERYSSALTTNINESAYLIPPLDVNLHNWNYSPDYFYEIRSPTPAADAHDWDYSINRECFNGILSPPPAAEAHNPRYEQEQPGYHNQQDPNHRHFNPYIIGQQRLMEMINNAVNNAFAIHLNNFSLYLNGPLERISQEMASHAAAQKRRDNQEFNISIIKK